MAIKVVLLIVGLIIALVTDLRKRKIYNWLTFPLFVTGIFYSTFVGGLGEGSWMSAGESALRSIWGGVLPLLILSIPYRMRAIGGGDLKLMAGIGAWMGPWFALFCVLFSAIFGGVLAILIMILNRQKSIMDTIRGLAFAFRLGIRPERPNAFGKKFPYSFSIFLGFIATIFWLKITF